MKRNILFTGSLAIVLTMSMISGCKKDDDNTTPATDVTAPVITVTGSNPYSHTVGQTYVDPGATATDAVDGTVTVTSNVSSTNPNVNVVGAYTITYTATDHAGNVAHATRTVNVAAATATVATYLWNPYPTHGYHATDALTTGGAGVMGINPTYSGGINLVSGNNITITNFLGYGSSCNATVNGSGTLTLTSPFVGSYQILNGTGTMNGAGTVLTILYDAKLSSITEHRKAILTKF